LSCADAGAEIAKLSIENTTTAKTLLKNLQLAARQRVLWRIAYSLLLLIRG
jgi:hypothetical protein